MRKRSSNTQTRRSTPFHDDTRTTHPLQRQSLDFYSTYPPSDILQSCQDDEWSSEESPSPVTVNNSRDTSSSIHDVPSVAPVPSHEHPASLHHPLTPFLTKRRCSSLPPSFRQPENISSRTPSSRAAPPIGYEGFMSSSTPHTPHS